MSDKKDKKAERSTDENETNDERHEVKSRMKSSRPYRITDGSGFRLDAFDPGDTGDMSKDDKDRAKKELGKDVEVLSSLQEKLYAQARWGVLVIFQAMDAAGKDGCIKHVMSGVNPQGCKVISFKTPSSQERRHDYLWRCAVNLPERGQIGVFNRSYYEEVLITRVHPNLIDAQNLPEELAGDDLWRNRYEDIVNFERFLTRNGFVILKFFLHVSKEEQKRRFMKRLDDPAKNWKFSAADVAERARWDDYQSAYETMIRETSSSFAPWRVVPADHKWYSRRIVAASIIDALDPLALAFPEPPDGAEAQMDKARNALLNETT